MDSIDDLSEAPDELLWGRLGEVQGLARADVLLELAKRADAKGENSRAVALLEEAASEAEQIDDSRLSAHARYLEGMEKFAIADYMGAADAYLKAVEHSHSIGRQSDQAYALAGRADALRAAGKFSDAASAATDSRALAEAEGLAELGGDASYTLARALYLMDREEEALQACRTGRDLYRSVSAVQGVARIDDFALTIHLYLNNLDEALELARNCYVLAATTPSPNDDGYATRRLAEVHLRRGEHSAARERAEQARELYRSNDVMIGVARSDVIRAAVLRDEGKLEGSLEVITDARVVFDSVGADDEAQSCDIKRAILLHGIGQYREAAAVNRRLVDTMKGEPHASGRDLHWSVLRLADNLLAAGDEEGALERLASWMHLWETDEAALRPSKRWAMELCAQAMGRTGRVEDAAELAGLALELTDEGEIDYLTAEMYELRARWMLDRGDRQGRQELAQAIAIHLAFGSTQRARDLSSYFMPEAPAATPDHAWGPGDVELSAA